jgi:hypothetical protein
VLVTDGETRAALACVRALAARGHTVHVAASGARSLAGASRHAAAVHEVGDPNADPRGYAERSARAARDARADRILPVTEVTLGSIYAFGVDGALRGRVSRARRLRGRRSTSTSCSRARRAGTRNARERCSCEDRRRLTRCPSRSVSRSCSRRAARASCATGAGCRAMAHSCATRRSSRRRGRRRLRGGCSAAGVRAGRGEGVFLLCRRGRALARFAHRRICARSRPGAVCRVLSEAIAPDPELLAAASGLLADLGFHGVAMVEFRRAPDGTAF